jgi:nucleoside 2-deoxyribosyltransferase
MRPKLYFAAPLFSEAELSFNSRIAKLLSPFFSVYLPQEDGCLMVELVRSGVSVKEAEATVFQLDMIALRQCNVFLIVLDGRVIDEGAAFELGVAHAFGKTCVGLQTDPRRLLGTGNNPMISSALSSVFSTSETLLEWANRYSQGKESTPSSIWGLEGFHGAQRPSAK